MVRPQPRVASYTRKHRFNVDPTSFVDCNTRLWRSCICEYFTLVGWKHCAKIRKQWYDWEVLLYETMGDVTIWNKQNCSNILFHSVLLFNKLLSVSTTDFSQCWPNISKGVYYEWMRVDFGTALDQHWQLYVLYFYR